MKRRATGRQGPKEGLSKGQAAKMDRETDTGQRMKRRATEDRTPPKHPPPPVHRPKMPLTPLKIRAIISNKSHPKSR